MITNLNTIKEWFRTGRKPTQSQFWATWDSFWHKHEGVVIKHPTVSENNAGKKTLDVLTNGEATSIPKSGSYTGSMEDLYNLIGVPEYGILTRWAKGCQGGVANSNSYNEKGDHFRGQLNASTVVLDAIWKGNNILDYEEDYIYISVYTIDEENQQ